MRKMATSLINDIQKIFGLKVLDGYARVIDRSKLQSSNNLDFKKFSRISVFATKMEENPFFVKNKEIGILCFEFEGTDEVGFLFIKSPNNAFNYFKDIEYCLLNDGKPLYSINDFLILDLYKIR